MKGLWARGRLSARELHQAVGEPAGWSYSTTRTNLRRMEAKGFVRRDTFHRLQLYEACVSRAAGLARLVRDFADRVLEVEDVPVASMFAGTTALSQSELAELEKLVARESSPRRKRRGRRP